LVLSNLDESISIASIVEDSSSVFHIVNAKESVISSSKLEWLVPNSLADSFCSRVCNRLNELGVELLYEEDVGRGSILGDS
jgi:hypothetical protein